MSDRALSILGRADVWAAVALLVGFFGLAWSLRKAPIGQPGPVEPEEAPPSKVRDRAAIGSALGATLVLLGAYLALGKGLIGPSGLAFAAGVALLLLAIRAARPDRHRSPTLRRVELFAQSVVTLTLLAGSLVVGNALAFRLGGPAIDLTHDRAYSLSSRSTNRVKALDRPLTFTTFFGNSESSTRQFDRVMQLVELYRAANPGSVRVEALSPMTDATEFEALAKRVPDVAGAAGDGLVLTLGEGASAPSAVVTARELFEGAPADRPGRFVSTFRGEDVVTSALIRLAEGKRSRVAFTTGHDELSTVGADAARPGLFLWRTRLSSVGDDAVEVNLLTDEVPDDATLLVICGPRSPFQEAEVDRIKRHLARNRPLLVLLNNAAPTGLDALLATYNVAVGPGTVVDPRLNYAGRPWVVYAPIPRESTHPVVSPLAGRVVLVDSASPLSVLGLKAGGRGPASSGTSTPSTTPPNPGIVAVPIVQTSREAWAESDLKAAPFGLDPKAEVAGPVPLAIAASTRPALDTEAPTPRLVVFSSPSLADDRLARVDPTNLDLLMNAVSWLRGRPESIGIAPKTHESLMLDADPGLRLRLVMVPTVVALVVIVGLGLATYHARRD